MNKINTIVRVQQTFDCSMAQLWKAITDVETMKLWYFDNIPDFKAEEGFHTHFHIQSGVRDFHHLWEVVKVVPEQEITYLWTYSRYTGKASVTFLMTPLNHLCQLTVTSKVLEPFDDDIPEFTKESCQGGWDYFIKERLTRFIKNN